MLRAEDAGDGISSCIDQRMAKSSKRYASCMTPWNWRDTFLRIFNPLVRAANNCEVVFAVIGKSSNPLEIPFFSKVSLENARRRLQGYGYKVSKKRIRRVAV